MKYKVGDIVVLKGEKDGVTNRYWADKEVEIIVVREFTEEFDRYIYKIKRLSDGETTNAGEKHIKGYAKEENEI